MPGYRVNHQCDAVDKEQPRRCILNATHSDKSYESIQMPLGKYMSSDDTIKIQTEKAIPMDGEMTFDGNVTDILDSLRVLLGRSIVRMHVSWSLVE